MVLFSFNFSPKKQAVTLINGQPGDYIRNRHHIRNAVPKAQSKRPVLMVAVGFSGNHNRDAQDFKLEDVTVEKKWFLQKKKMLRQLRTESD